VSRCQRRACSAVGEGCCPTCDSSAKDSLDRVHSTPRAWCTAQHTLCVVHSTAHPRAWCTAQHTLERGAQHSTPSSVVHSTAHLVRGERHNTTSSACDQESSQTKRMLISVISYLAHTHPIIDYISNGPQRQRSAQRTTASRTIKLTASNKRHATATQLLSRMAACM
jgi:hypothetical protein